MDKLFGLVGHPLGHSFSMKYFTAKFEANNITDSKYVNFDLDSIEQFPQIIAENPTLHGLNVTIPYKEQVIRFLDETDPEIDKIKAVNTIKFIRTNGKTILKGYNTDIYGFENSIAPHLTPAHTKALILGTGGASKAIKYVFDKLGIDYLSASIDELKEKEIRYTDITEDMVAERKIIVNATPLGTYPKEDACADIPYAAITAEHIMFDLVYNPPVSKFLSYGQLKGATIINGLKMLHLQAEKSNEIWNS